MLPTTNKKHGEGGTKKKRLMLHLENKYVLVEYSKQGEQQVIQIDLQMRWMVVQLVPQLRWKQAQTQ